MILLVGCDMVFGIQWLVSLGSIIWNFKALTMKFTIANKIVLLQGLMAPYLWEEIELSFSKDKSPKGLLLQLLDNVEDSVMEPLKVEVEGLLDSFVDIFAEPKGLPPNRTHGHAITPEYDAQPVRVRPYRYPYFQKEEIEKIV